MFTHLSKLRLLVAIATFSLVQPEVFAQTKIQIGRHTSAGSLTDQEADKILANCTATMNQNGCHIKQFQRNGSVSTFSAGSGAVYNRSSYNQYNDMALNVRVVSMITWCAGAGGPDTAIVGCSDQPSGRFSISVLKRSASRNHLLWLHEYGHNCGLGHMDSPGNVMNPVLDDGNTQLTADQCIALKNGPGGSQRAVAAENEGKDEKTQDDKDNDGNAGGGDGNDKMDITTFVGQDFIHGVPFDKASKYGAKDVPVLVDMLMTRKEEEAWPNIVATLSYIGDPQAVKPLIEFFERGEGKISTVEYTAKNGVLIHLGDLINKSKSEEGQQFLLRGISNAGEWVEKLNWTSPLEGNREILGSSALWGLALAGTDATKRKLQVIAADRDIPAERKQTVLEALNIHDQVAANGIRAYRMKMKH